MSDLANQCVTNVQAAGGSMLYSELVESIDARNRQKVFSAVKEAVNAGQLARVQAYTPETGVQPLTINYIGG